LYQPVLALASETVDNFVNSTGRTIVKIAGIAGPIIQAAKEARVARDLGYHLGMISLGGLRHDASNAELVAHLWTIADIIPIMGFYLQPAVGGRVLDYDFWRQAVEIENLMAIKIAPFNRYFTLDVLRAVAESQRANQIALYTGNDDSIVIDLLSEFQFSGREQAPTLRIVGGLLGQWAIWTKKAVELLDEIQQLRARHQAIPMELLRKAQQITDANGAIFDAHNNFAGSIPGIHEILRRQGLLEGRWTLNPNEELSPGQMAQIDRIYHAYPHLHDDDFVKENLEKWLR
jgi:dihydrodipicolinate synthase/N-acetylneuraminate lyase